MAQIVSDVETVLNNQQAKKETKTERQKILAEMERVRAEKANLVKKSLAAQRAKFGAGGGGEGLSTDAVLKRLSSETAEPYDEKLRDASEKIRKIKTPKSNLFKTILKQFDSVL